MIFLWNKIKKISAIYTHIAIFFMVCQLTNFHLSSYHNTYISLLFWIKKVSFPFGKKSSTTYKKSSTYTNFKCTWTNIRS